MTPNPPTVSTNSAEEKTITISHDRIIYILTGYGLIMWAFGFAWGRLV